MWSVVLFEGKHTNWSKEAHSCVLSSSWSGTRRASETAGLDVHQCVWFRVYLTVRLFFDTLGGTIFYPCVLAQVAVSRFRSFPTRLDRSQAFPERFPCLALVFCEASMDRHSRYFNFRFAHNENDITDVHTPSLSWMLNTEAMHGRSLIAGPHPGPATLFHATWQTHTMMMLAQSLTLALAPSR